MRPPTCKEKKEIKTKGYCFGSPDDDVSIDIDTAEVGYIPDMPLGVFIGGRNDSAGKGYKANICADLGGALILCTALEVAKDDGTMMVCGRLASWKLGGVTYVLEDTHCQFVSKDPIKCKEFIEKLRELVYKRFHGIRKEDWEAFDVEDDL